MRRTSFAALLGFGLLLLPAAARAQAVKPRFVIILDTSSSMAENPRGRETHGDGSEREPGCDLDNNGAVDDSRMFQAKGALSDTLAAFGSAEFAFARFKGLDLGQPCNSNTDCPAETECFAPPGGGAKYCASLATHYRECSSPNAGQACCTACYSQGTCGGCSGCDTCTRCKSTIDYDRITFRATGCRSGPTCLYPDCKAGEVLVPFPAANGSNYGQIYKWIDGKEGVPPFAGGVNPDPEIRVDVGTPLASSLGSVRGWLNGDSQIGPGAGAIAGDPKGQCRQYSVILLTDGAESCPSGATGDANARSAAAELAAQGVKVYVIGFGVGSTDQSRLNGIAQGGGTTSAYFPNDRSELTAALADIIARSLPKAVCDCNSTCDDEATAFPNKGQACAVGVGRCKRAGTFGCNAAGDGTWCSATPPNMCPAAGLAPGAPVAEKCGVNTEAGPCLAPTLEDCADDDCDGVVDNGLNCNCAARPEICNGKDDDCNDKVDDIAAVPCGVDVGACKAGVTRCQPDGMGGARTVCEGATSPAAEECNGVDDNCNGITDDVPARACYPTPFMGCTYDAASKSYQCKGICSPGTQVCSGGSWEASACMGAVTPLGDDIPCDGLDNDCDGQVDETNPGPDDACYPDGIAGCRLEGTEWKCTGACKPGRKMCDGTSGQIVCGGAGTPGPEVCDTQDNNCDGTTDEGFDVGVDCQVGTGACGKARKVCNAVGTGTICPAIANEMTDEVCDGRDNDCDGEIDEAPLPGVGLACGSQVGECKQGTQMCANGKLVCNDVGPAMEVCDGKDNDCNGSIDDALAGNGMECRPMGVPGGPMDPIKGECRPGRMLCVEGKWDCRGGVVAGMEICDGKDNDCDGRVDNDPYCPENTRCIEGECVPRCRNEEVAKCPPDRLCRDGYCLRKACAIMSCPEGQFCDGEGKCQDPCANAKCPSGTTCERGQCVDCHTKGCKLGEVCGVHTCMPDPCHNTNCAPGTYCRNGTCVKECTLVTCKAGERCKDGACVVDRCATVTCEGSQYCDPADGLCKPSACSGLQCLPGLACVEKSGKCEPDPCTTTRCGRNDACVVMVDGTAECQRRRGVNPVVNNFAASGGGLATCSCRIGGTGRAAESAGLWLTLAAGAFTLARRRRRAATRRSEGAGR